jgi:hypothetical protein
VPFSWSFSADKDAETVVLRQRLEKLETLAEEITKASEGGVR